VALGTAVPVQGVAMVAMIILWQFQQIKLSNDAFVNSLRRSAHKVDIRISRAQASICSSHMTVDLFCFEADSVERRCEGSLNSSWTVNGTVPILVLMNAYFGKLSDKVAT
jgi:hypothetical protein